ncbi:hypothetical protein LSTR_LSTR016016 [Laodelphax striatellus]|uniref:Uncharacterized protein n=1 Tax=Laodelphax striatellus TaxID=195883 RepID=A0A482WVH4_LAOST|nr:hypothetical protein LSTR_LSTR016016 [Laodelphax striatellus]
MPQLLIEQSSAVSYVEWVRATEPMLSEPRVEINVSNAGSSDRPTPSSACSALSSTAPSRRALAAPVLWRIPSGLV